MITLRKDKRTWQCPTNADELTLKNFIDLAKWAEGEHKDTASFMQALTGMDIDDCMSTADKWAKYIDFESIIKALNEYPTKEPTTLDVSGYDVGLKPFALLYAGQRVMLRDVVGSGNIIHNLDKILAICVAPQIYEEQWASNIDLLMNEIGNCKASEAVPMAYFFLSSGMHTKNNGLTYPLRLILTLSRQKMEGLKSMAFGR